MKILVIGVPEITDGQQIEISKAVTSICGVRAVNQQVVDANCLFPFTEVEHRAKKPTKYIGSVSKVVNTFNIPCTGWEAKMIKAYAIDNALDESIVKIIAVGPQSSLDYEFNVDKSYIIELTNLAKTLLQLY